LASSCSKLATIIAVPVRYPTQWWRPRPGRSRTVARIRHLLELLGEQRKARTESRSNYDGAGGIWTQCNDLKGHERLRSHMSRTTQCIPPLLARAFHRQSIPLLPRPSSGARFEEERQLIARLRLAEAPAPDTDRQSYIFIQKVRATHKRLCGLIDVQVVNKRFCSATRQAQKCRISLKAFVSLNHNSDLSGEIIPRRPPFILKSRNDHSSRVIPQGHMVVARRPATCCCCFNNYAGS
jgi:hypothetical protein